ncbi:hypothetical protein CYMTET_41463, partial [Cymbomonas tetramitiformis]
LTTIGGADRQSSHYDLGTGGRGAAVSETPKDVESSRGGKPGKGKSGGPMKRKASSVPAQASSPRSHIPKQRRSDLGAVLGGKETAADMDEESDEEMMDLDDLQAFSIRDRWDDADIGSGEQPLTGGAPAATAARAAATIAAFATAAAATTRTAGTANANVAVQLYSHTVRKQLKKDHHSPLIKNKEEEEEE